MHRCMDRWVPRGFLVLASPFICLGLYTYHCDCCSRCNRTVSYCFYCSYYSYNCLFCFYERIEQPELSVCECTIQIYNMSTCGLTKNTWRTGLTKRMAGRKQRLKSTRQLLDNTESRDSEAHVSCRSGRHLRRYGSTVAEGARRQGRQQNSITTPSPDLRQPRTN